MRHFLLPYVIVIGTLAFMIVAILRIAWPGFDAWDARLSGALIADDSGLTRIIVILTEFFNFYVVAGLVAAASLLLFIRKKTSLAMLHAGSIVLAAALFSSLKVLFQFARPENGLVDVMGWGFPSGHAAVSTAYFLFFAYIIRQTNHSPASRILFYLLTIGMIVGVGISRIYLGVHWPSDVVAGFCIGIVSFILVLWTLTYRKY